MHPSLEIEHLSVSNLLPHELNPRKHGKRQIRQIAESIRIFGFKVPVLVDANDRLICGHGRVAACKLLGIESVPAIRTSDLDDAKIRAFMIADNRLTEIAGWDDSLLAENFKILSELDLDFDLEVTGFDYGDIENLLSQDDDGSPEEPPVPSANTLPAVARARRSLVARRALRPVWRQSQARILWAPVPGKGQSCDRLHRSTLQSVCPGHRENLRSESRGLCHGSRGDDLI